MSLKSRVLGAWNNLVGVRTEPYLFPNSVPVNNHVTWIADNLERYITDGYAANDVVYSIGHITSEKIKVAPWAAYKVKDEGSLKRMKALQEQGRRDGHIDHKGILDLQTKALELFTGDSRLNELLKYPNEEETFSDLVAHSSIAKMMMGNRYIKATLLEGGANGGKPYELELLPSQYVGIKCNRVYPIRKSGFQLTVGTQAIPFSTEEILHDKYFNMAYAIDGSHLVGMAPLKAALKTLTNDNSSLEASTKSFQNMGPGGALWVDDDRLSGKDSVEQAGAIKAKFIEEYSGTSNAKKIVVSGYKVGFTEMGLSPVDLNIILQQKWNLVRFCNVWNFPHLLLLSDHATDNNAGWAERALTSRCAMPLLTSFRDNFNRKLQSDWGYKGQNIYIDFDQSVYSELEVNRKEQMDWMKDAILSVEQRYAMLQIEIPEYMDDETRQMILVPNGYRPIEDLKMGDIEGDLKNQGFA